jgi:hypothetical protein
MLFVFLLVFKGFNNTDEAAKTMKSSLTVSSVNVFFLVFCK